MAIRAQAANALSHTHAGDRRDFVCFDYSDSPEDAVLGRRHMTALLPSDPEQQEGKTTRRRLALNDRFERVFFTDRRSPACTS